MRKPTAIDELTACLIQLSADLEQIADTLDYIGPVQERVSTLLEQLQSQQETA